MEKATLGGGCFWCTEAIFKRLKGVSSVSSGYAGGEKENPSYEDVSSGQTNYAEVIQIEFDPNIITYETLLKIFFRFHDPTTLNRQGADIGSQYRSAIFYHNGAQKKIAQETIDKLSRSKEYENPVITQLIPFSKFYTAEEYHQNFYAKNPSLPYCQIVIEPKIQKLLDEFKGYLK